MSKKVVEKGKEETTIRFRYDMRKNSSEKGVFEHPDFAVSIDNMEQTVIIPDKEVKSHE